MERVTASLRSRLHESLLKWYEKNRRDLPWRRTLDPYRIWVSEVILQQTQVAAALGHYQRFVESFPNVQSLAAAPLEKVLSRWSGLGYYNRARNLHAAARQLVEHFDGRLPSDPRALSLLPGIGRYTAGAIASIAYGVPAAAVDGNVERVLARLFARRHRRLAEQKKWSWKMAERLVPAIEAGQWNQALMELGALVCRPVTPDCKGCPIRSACRARLLGLEQRIPATRPGGRTVRFCRCAAIVVRDGRVLLVQRADPVLMKDLWELPAVEGDAAAAVESFARRGITIGRTLGQIRHAITYRDIRLDVVRGRLQRGRSLPASRWLPLDRIAEVPHSSQLTKALRLLEKQ